MWIFVEFIQKANLGTIFLAMLLPFALAIGGFVYLIVVLLLKIITKNDVFMLPKGEKIAKVLEKFHWIG